MTAVTLLTQAADAPSVTLTALVIGALAGALPSIVTFFVKRAVKKKDEKEKSEAKKKEDEQTLISNLLKEVGKLELKNDAQWRIIDEVKSDVKDLRNKVYEAKK